VREIGKVPMMGTKGEKLCEGGRETGGSHDDVTERLNYPVRSNRESNVIHDNVMEKGILTPSPVCASVQKMYEWTEQKKKDLKGKRSIHK
jgi:hypothetical protein